MSTAFQILYSHEVIEEFIFLNWCEKQDIPELSQFVKWLKEAEEE
jgi:hypothetical protein